MVATMMTAVLQAGHQLRMHLADFVAPDNYARRLKTLRGRTPHEAICKAWAENPSLFTAKPHHHLPGPNS